MSARTINVSKNCKGQQELLRSARTVKITKALNSEFFIILNSENVLKKWTETCSGYCV